jgi:predicted MFS family arabinose efflux permease
MTVLNAPKRCHRFLSWRNCVNRATWKERSKNAAPAYENGYPAYAACGFPPTPAAPRDLHRHQRKPGANRAEAALMDDTPARHEWREGWPLPLTSAIGYGVGVAQIYSFGLFIAPLQKEFGWSRTATSSGLTVLSAILLLAPVAGTLIDRWGPRRIAIPGMLFYCAALAALSLAGHALWSWWLLWVLVGFGTLAVQPTTWASAVVSRFDRTRGLALSVTLCGSGLGAAILPLVTNRLLLSFGWRGAYVALGGVLALVSIPLLILFFRDAKDLQNKRAKPGAKPHMPAANGTTFAEALRSARFWRLAIVSFLAVGAIVALLVHFVPILIWKGLPRTKAAEIAGVIGIGSIAGRLITGVLLDRINGSIVGAVGFSLPILVLLTLIFADANVPATSATALLFGLTLGCEIDVLGYLTSRHFGMRNFGAVFGMLVGLQSLAVRAGPAIAAFVFDRTGSYQLVLIGLMPVFAASATLISTLGAYPAFEQDAPAEHHSNGRN